MISGPQNIRDILEIFRRRRRSIALTISVFTVASALVALAIPPRYKSTATILIEEQEIPPEYVLSTVTGYADKRLQTIQQRIMSFNKLLDVINRFNLYPSLRAKRTTEEIVEEMRKDIELKTLSAEVIDPRTGQLKKATIAFTLSYIGKDPVVVQQVANVLASLYLEENIRIRERQAQEALRFFDEEAKAIKEHLAELEAKIATFKKRHVNELPELLQINLQGLERTERDIEATNDQIRALKERESYLQTQLAAIPPSNSEDKKRLDELRVVLSSLSTRFSDKHPDVVKTRAEIAALERVLANQEGKEGSGGSPNSPDNPVYVNLAAQLASLKAEIDSYKRQLEDLKKRRDEYRRRIEATPRIEEEYRVLLVERENTQQKFNDLMKKSLEAKVAHELEKDQKGERFTLIDPPRVPERPYQPDRMLILLVGLVLGFFVAGMVAFVREMSDQAFYQVDHLEAALGMPVLAAIPVIITDEDRKFRRRRLLAVGGALATLLLLGILVVHYMLMDLEVLWARLARYVAKI